MSEKGLLKKLVLSLILLASTGGLLSCTLPTPGEEVAVAHTGPQAWIDVPVEGLHVPVNQPVRIEGHAAYRESIDRVEVWVDGALYLAIENLSSEEGLTHFEEWWLPPGPGEYVIQAVAIGTDGATSAPNSVHLSVGDETAEATPTSTPIPPTSAPIPPTDAPASPTDPPPAPTDTPFPPAEVSFWADRTSMISGECTVLHWDVEQATAVLLDSEGVAGHGTREVCLAKTTTYVLHVEAPGGDVDRSVTINVSADNTPPPVPTPQVPADGLEIACPATEKQTLVWLPVTDPSGVAYSVKLERQVKAGVWESEHMWDHVITKQVEAEVLCGGIYRWAVRAKDSAGNTSAWSAWSFFSISLD